MSDPSTLKTQFESIGLDEKTADSASKSKVAKLFADIITESGFNGNDKNIANLLYAAASKLPTTSHRANVVKYIANKGIKTTPQLDAAIKYLKSKGMDSEFNAAEFEKATGVGVVITPEQIKSTIDRIIDANLTQLKEERYRMAGKLIASINQELTWGDGALIKKMFDEKLLATIGEKTEEDTKKVKPTKDANVKEEKKTTEEKPAEINWLELLDGREIPEARNTQAWIDHHKKVSGGAPITRFPPEPNGYLHIGHAKAMNFNFGLAKKFSGKCIMRFDDTNPEAEKLDYITNILENVHWLGHSPARVTYSSDYFQELYDLAVKLIKKGKAYVDHQTGAEIKASRETRTPSPWRERPMEENLRLFEDMRKGKFGEGEATLRMKGDMNAANPQMWDLVAYRIKYSPHPHVGDKWCIYPSYDYTHCIIDSLEDISHSCCTLEFEVRRESYYWLLHELDLYKPKVWEYSRLNIEHTVMSKRRLLKLVMENYVNGWDDPRLPTLNGLRRRGYTPEAINLFCETIGVSRAENTIPMHVLEHCCRQVLEPISRRAMVVEQPVKVILTNYPADKVETFKAPNFPKDESKGTHDIPFSRIVYIDRADVKLEDDKDFFGLTPNKTVHLKYSYNITATKFNVNKDGSIESIEATVDLNSRNSKDLPKGKIQWVAEPAPGVEPLKVELRLYDVLFKSANPGELDEWLADLNPQSLVTVTNAYAVPAVKESKPNDKFQFERLAFFNTDLDSKPDHLIFNRTVTLKESKPKDAKPKNERAPRKPKA